MPIAGGPHPPSGVRTALCVNRKWGRPGRDGAVSFVILRVVGRFVMMGPLVDTNCAEIASCTQLLTPSAPTWSRATCLGALQIMLAYR